MFVENTRRCIICGDTKPVSFFNKEHIIPDALGNKTLFFYQICTDCNSNLGREIDVHLTDNLPMKLIRCQLGLKSQNGIIPNPFSKGTDEAGKEIKVTDDFRPFRNSYIEKDGEHWRISAQTLDEALKISEKALKRAGKNDDEIKRILADGRHEHIQETPTISYTDAIDLQKIKLAILKIAYEYSCHKFGDAYFDDKTAQIIRGILHKASKAIEFEDYEDMGYIPDEIYSLLAKFENMGSHCLFFVRDKDNRLILQILLFFQQAFSYGIVVSNDATKYDCFLHDPVEFVGKH